MNVLKLTKLVNRIQICGEVISTDTIIVKDKPRIKFTLLGTYDKVRKAQRTYRCLLTEPTRRTAARLFKGSFVFILDGYLQTYSDDTYMILCRDIAVFYEDFANNEMTEEEITEFLTKNGLESLVDKVDLEGIDVE